MQAKTFNQTAIQTIRCFIAKIALFIFLHVFVENQALPPFEKILQEIRAQLYSQNAFRSLLQIFYRALFLAGEFFFLRGDSYRRSVCSPEKTPPS